MLYLVVFVEYRLSFHPSLKENSITLIGYGCSSLVIYFNVGKLVLHWFYFIFDILTGKAIYLNIISLVNSVILSITVFI